MDLKNDSLSLHHPSTYRDLIKDIYIRSVDAFFTNNIKKKPSVQFLYSHYLFKDEMDGFIQLIGFLQKNFTIISYSEAVNKITTSEIDDYYICFSFDDGIKNCMRIAEEFYRRGISAAFFLNPKVIEQCNNVSFIQQHCTNNLHLKELDFMNWEDVEDLLKMGHEIGNHTYSHQRLSKIKEEDFKEEILFSKEVLEKKAGKINHFAWTYGTANDISNEAFNYIISSGHDSVASAIRGQHFSKIDLKTKYILRDLLVFKQALYYFRYFYRKSNHSGQPASMP